MAELDVGKLSLTIEADGRAAITELARVEAAAEGMAQNVAGTYDDAGRDMAEAFGQVGDAAEDAGEEVTAAARKMGDEAEATGKKITEANEKASKSVKDYAESMEKVGTKMSATITAPLTALYAVAVNGASDLEETVSKTEVVFGRFSDSMMDWAETSVQKMGMAQGTALEMSSKFGDMAVGMGLAESAAAQMSMNLTQLTADLASFKNADTAQVAQALTGIFTGEGEALKGLGVVMTQVNLQNFAYTQGITKQISAMTQAEQIQLRYNYVMAQTAKAQGDFARTGDSFANRSRKLTETLKSIGEEFGSMLLPIVTDFFGKIQEGLDWLDALDERTKAIILSTTAVVAAIGPVLLIGSKVLTMVTALKGALAALSLNPVLLGLAGLAAAGAGIVALTKKMTAATNEIDKTTAAYQRMESIFGDIDAEVKVEVNTEDVKDIEVDGEVKLKPIDKPDDVEVDGDVTLNPIDKPDNVAVDGDVTLNPIDKPENVAVDGDVTLNPIDKPDNVAIDGDVTLNPIEQPDDIEVKGDFSWKEKAEKELKKFLDGLQKLPEDKTYKATGEFVIAGASEDVINAYAEALFKAAAATGNYAENVDLLKQSIDTMATEKTNELTKDALEEMSLVETAYAQGDITAEVRETEIAVIIGKYQDDLKTLKADVQALQKSADVYKNGTAKDDQAEYLKTTEMLYRDAEYTPEQRSKAQTKVKETKAGGGDLTGAKVEASIVKDTLLTESAEKYTQLAAAVDAYNKKMGDANKEETAAAERAEQMRIATDIVGEYWAQTAADTSGSEAFDNILTQYDEVLNAHTGLREKIEAVLKTPEGEFLDVTGAMEAFDVMIAKEEEAAVKAEEAAQAAASARESAQSDLQIAATTLSEGASVEELQNTIALIKEAGVELGAAEEQAVVGGQQIISAFAAELSGGEAEVETAATNAMSGLDTIMTNISREAALNGAQEMVNDFSANISAGSGTMGAAAKTALSFVSQVFAQTATDGAKTGNSYVVNASSAIEAGKTTLFTAATNALAQITSAGSKSSAEGKGIGSNLIAGIKSGINGGLASAISTAASAIGSVIKAMKKKADINSPSRVTEDEVGVMLTRGVGVGVKKETPAVTKIMAESTRSIMSGATQVARYEGVHVPASTPTSSIGINYDLMGEKMNDAVNAMDFVFRVNDNDLSRATRESTARQQAMRAHEINLGRGRV